MYHVHADILNGVQHWFTVPGVPVNATKIKRLRLAKGLTQDQAATAAGMSGKQHWNNVESGRQAAKSVSVDLLERIAKTLGVKPAELLAESPPPKPRKH